MSKTKFLHIHSPEDTYLFQEIKKHINNKTHVFVLIFMEGCGPCNATRPQWKELETQNKLNPSLNTVIVDINQSFLDKESENMLGEIDGYPTIRYYNGSQVENYENAPIKTKDRSLDSFKEWIHSHTHKNKSKTTKKGGLLIGGRKKKYSVRRKKGGLLIGGRKKKYSVRQKKGKKHN